VDQNWEDEAPGVLTAQSAEPTHDLAPVKPHQAAEQNAESDQGQGEDVQQQNAVLSERGGSVQTDEQTNGSEHQHDRYREKSYPSRQRAFLAI
jgi:hypothetical protein